MTLTSPKDHPEMFLDRPAALSQEEVAPMLFTPDDDFHDSDDTWDLPDCAAALLARAGSWSARNQKNGFVPSSQLARFSSDPQAVRELLRRGLWRRVKGGFQFADWTRWGELAEEIERRRSDAAERQRRHRAKKKEGDEKVNPQVGGGDVTHMSRVTSRDSPRSDLDQDLNPSSGVTSQSDARGRENPELMTAVADAICAKVGYVPTDEQAVAVITAIRGRTRKRIRSPLKYIPAAVANEPDLWDGLLLPSAPPLAAVTSPDDPGRDAERHAYEPNPATGACRCDLPKSNWRHDVARSA